MMSGGYIRKKTSYAKGGRWHWKESKHQDRRALGASGNAAAPFVTVPAGVIARAAKLTRTDPRTGNKYTSYQFPLINDRSGNRIRVHYPTRQKLPPSDRQIAARAAFSAASKANRGRIPRGSRLV